MTLQGSQPLASVAPTTYTMDDGRVVTLPVVPPPPAGAELSITLVAQQIRTFICTV